MKETFWKGAISAAAAGVAAYFRALAAPVFVLIAVMLADYVTGMTRAWITHSFSSRTGVRGIVKKVLYLALVAVGMTADFLVARALADAGVQTGFTGAAGLMVTVWLIVNELISILENLSESAVPVPPFLVKLLRRLKSASERPSGEEGGAPEEKDRTE